jgi:hypothetical protein
LERSDLCFHLLEQFGKIGEIIVGQSGAMGNCQTLDASNSPLKVGHIV